MSKWNADELLSFGENIVYKCKLEDSDSGKKIDVYLTNYRIIWINGNFVDCRLLKFISKYGTFVGSELYAEEDDIGSGNYGIYFGDLNNYETFWFYSEEVRNAFYMELSRAILEN